MAYAFICIYSIIIYGFLIFMFDDFKKMLNFHIFLYFFLLKILIFHKFHKKGYYRMLMLFSKNFLIFLYTIKNIFLNERSYISYMSC